MACEDERTRLIGQIVSLLREGSVPDEAREAGLTLIGWLARRMPGEPVSMAGAERYGPAEANGMHQEPAPSAVKSNGRGKRGGATRGGAGRSSGRRSR
jgi:hypothetical protein